MVDGSTDVVDGLLEILVAYIHLLYIDIHSNNHHSLVNGRRPHYSLQKVDSQKTLLSPYILQKEGHTKGQASLVWGLLKEEESPS